MKTQQQKSVTIRYMRPSDIDNVAEVERVSGGRSHPDHGQWTKKDFREVILKTKNHAGLVAIRKSDNALMGYCIFGLYDQKIHICNLAVAKKFRGMGIATTFLNTLAGKLSETRPFLEIDVRESALNSQLYLRDREFRAYRVVRNWYKDTDEDAYKFRYTKEDYDA